VTFAVPTYAGGPGFDYFLIDGWYSKNDNYTITVVSPTGIVYPAVAKNSFFNGANNADGHVYIENGWWLIDPTRLAPIEGIVRIGSGRDASDIAFLTSDKQCQVIRQTIQISKAP